MILTKEWGISPCICEVYVETVLSAVVPGIGILIYYSLLCGEERGGLCSDGKGDNDESDISSGLSTECIVRHVGPCLPYASLPEGAYAYAKDTPLVYGCDRLTSSTKPLKKERVL